VAVEATGGFDRGVSRSPTRRGFTTFALHLLTRRLRRNSLTAGKIML